MKIIILCACTLAFIQLTSTTATRVIGDEKFESFERGPLWEGINNRLGENRHELSGRVSVIEIATQMAYHMIGHWSIYQTKKGGLQPCM